MEAEARIRSETEHENSEPLKQRVAHCFEATGADYLYWSRNLHMHFGVWRLGLNPFNLEGMLEQACHEVFAQFGRAHDESFDILDAGCGVGSSLGLARTTFPNAACMGVTLVPSQAEEAQRRVASRGCKVMLGDFECSELPSGSFDVVFSIEAAVYGSGIDKQRYLREACRLLRPGGRLIVMDGYLTKPAATMGWLSRWIYRRVCNGWAIDDMIEKAPFLSAADRIGFELKRFRWLSLAIAPAAAHVPAATMRYLWDSIVHKRRRSEESIRHVVSCVCGCLLGLHLHRFCYGMAVFQKRL